MAAIVQSVGNNNGAGATTLVLTIAASGAGRILAVMLGPRDTLTIAANGVSDNINGTTGWVIKNPTGATQNPSGLTTNKPAFAYNLGGSAGVTTITITLSASGVAGGFASEISYTGTPSFIECTISDNGSIAVTSWTSGTLDASGAAMFGLGISSAGTTGLTFTQGASWTALAGTGITAGSNTNGTDADQVFGEFRDFASGGVFAATGTSTSATQNSGVIFIRLTPAAGGGSTTKSSGTMLSILKKLRTRIHTR